jgi:hypothetical protein
MLVSGNRESKEADILRLKNQITSLESQMQSLDIEFNVALNQGNAYRAASLSDQIASKYEEQAILCDTLSTKLAGGPERDDCVRKAADGRAHAQRLRDQAAGFRSRR